MLRNSVESSIRFNTEYYTGIYCYYNVALLPIIRYYDNGDATRKTNDDG